jgi:hypothetical protein
MRILFLLLVLANVVFFAWSRYLSPGDAAADRAPLGRQIEPERLRIVPPGELTATARRKPAPAAQQPRAALNCIEWGSFTLPDALRAERALEPFALGPRLTQRRTEEQAGWWVFIPSQGTRQAAQTKAGELKGLGVEDYFVIQEDGAYRWGLSLGVFRSEEAAQARLARLREQGVRSARVGARETVVPKFWLQVSEVDAELEARLRELASRTEGSEIRACP